MIAFILFRLDCVLFGVYLVNLGFSIYDHKTAESLLNFMIVLLSLRCAMYDYMSMENENL